jgi:hypothetical protein
MQHHHTAPHDVWTIALLRAAGIALGGILLSALAILARTSLDIDRGAVLSQTAMRWSQPLIVAVVALWVVAIIVLLKAQWPPGQEMIASLRDIAMVAAVWMVALAAVAAGTTPGAVVVAGAVAYAAMGAVTDGDWIFLTGPAATFGFAFTTYFWLLLADDPSVFVERDLWPNFDLIAGVVIGPLLAIVTLVLIFSGRWISVILRDRLG